MFKAITKEACLKDPLHVQKIQKGSNEVSFDNRRNNHPSYFISLTTHKPHFI